MIKLKIKNSTIEPEFTYKLYKNIAGKDIEKRTDKFNTFLNGIFNDDLNQIIYFFYCVAGGELSEDEIARQVGDQKGFDNVHETVNGILQGFMSSGFFATAVKQLINSANDSIKGMQEASKISSLSKEELEVGKIQIAQQKKNVKAMEERIKK